MLTSSWLGSTLTLTWTLGLPKSVQSAHPPGRVRFNVSRSHCSVFHWELADISVCSDGSFFWQAATEGLIARNRSAHAGIRTRLDTYADVVHDINIGFQIFTTDDIDDVGPAGIAAAIRQRVGDMPVYLSIDIDILDPGFAPGQFIHGCEVSNVLTF